jgi:Cdc6-like AAA superfamily ATPase
MSDLPTNRGVIVMGSPGTGKTALLLKLVETSCFGAGRSEPIYQGTIYRYIMIKCTLFSKKEILF